VRGKSPETASQGEMASAWMAMGPRGEGHWAERCHEKEAGRGWCLLAPETASAYANRSPAGRGPWLRLRLISYCVIADPGGLGSFISGFDS
jgi:hypothetical protein